MMLRFGKLLIPAVKSRLIVFDRVVHQHHILCCCRLVAATPCAHHKQHFSRSFKTCSQHRLSAVCTVSNDYQPLLTPATTIFLSPCLSFRSLPKYDSEQSLQDKHTTMEVHSRENKTHPVKEPKQDDDKIFSPSKKHINVGYKTELSQPSVTPQSDDIVSQPGDAVSQPDGEVSQVLSQTRDVDTENKKGIFARFKLAYKEYGKVLIGVHLATSTVWFSTFYYAAVTGIDVIPMLENLGVGETVLKTFSNPAIGDVAVAYLLYKIATPVRYTVTIGGTHWTVRQLRRLGYMKPVPHGDSIRSLMKEGREQMKEKAESMKDRADDVREKIKEKTKDRVDNMKDTMQKKRQNK